jgi:nucleoside-diphosphate-sugar epimerase
LSFQAYEGKRVLITGGLGFVGSHLSEKLNEYGAKVFIIDNKEKHEGTLVNFKRCDITEPSQLAAIITDISPEVVFHLAANINRASNFDMLYDMIDINLAGTLNLFAALTRVASLRSIVVAGTCEEYGVNEVPFQENLKENPVTPYSFSKVCTTYLAKMACNVYQLPVIVLRATLAYGPGQGETMFIPSLIKTLLRDEDFLMTAGEQTRDFIYIDDLLNGYLKAGMLKGHCGEVFNIGSGRGCRIKEVARLIASAMNKEHLLQIGAKEYRPSEIMSYRADISKARNVLDWYPTVKIEEGLERTIESLTSGRNL